MSFIWLKAEPQTRCYGEIVYLKGAEDGISLSVNKVTTRYIMANILKSHVSDIRIRPDSPEAYPDIIYLNNKHQKMRCKVTGVTAKTYIIQIPMEEVESLDMDQEMDTDNMDNPDLPPIIGGKTASSGHPQKSPQEEPLDLELLEDMKFGNEIGEEEITGDDILVRETLSDIETDPPHDPYSNLEPTAGHSTDETDIKRLKDEIKQEIINEMAKKEAAEEEKLLKETTGRVEGKISKKGLPFPGCKVMIVTLSEERILFLKQIKRGDTLETITDENGRYYLENVQAGNYKLFWKPPYETSWIRRFSMEPDVIVTAGKTTYTKDIEINKRVVN